MTKQHTRQPSKLAQRVRSVIEADREDENIKALTARLVRAAELFSIRINAHVAQARGRKGEHSQGGKP